MTRSYSRISLGIRTANARAYGYKGLPPLFATEIVAEHTPWVNGGCKDANGNYRKVQGCKERDPKTRAKTFSGIARAMAEQWGGKL